MTINDILFILTLIATVGGTVFGIASGKFFRQGLSESNDIITKSLKAISEDTVRKDNENKELRDRLDIIEDKYQKLKIDFDDLVDKQRDVQELMEKLGKENLILQAKVQDGDTSQKCLLKELDTLKAEYNDLQTKYKELERLYTELANKNTDSIKQLTSQLDTVKTFLIDCGITIEQFELILTGTLKGGYIYERSITKPTEQPATQPEVHRVSSDDSSGTSDSLRPGTAPVSG